MEELKLPIYLDQYGVHVAVLMTEEELELFNKRTDELVAQDPSWSERPLEIFYMVREELKTKQK